MKKIISGFFICAFLLSGCGGNEETKIDKNTGKEQLIVAMDCASAPYTYLVDRQNENTVAFGKSLNAAGYDVTLAKDLATAMKKDLVIKKMSSDKFAEALDTGEVDIVMSGVMKNNKEESFTYSSAYATSEIVLVTRKDDKISAYTKLNQFKNVKIAGQSSTMSDVVIDQIKNVKHEKAQVNTATLLKSLKDKKVDAITLDRKLAERAVAQNADFVIIKLEKGFSDASDIVIAMKEDSKDSETYKKVESFLKKLTDEKKKEYMDVAIKQSPAFLK